MRLLISAALTMLLIGLAAGVQGEENSSPEAVDVFHSFLSAFSRSDVDGIVNVFSEDAIFWGTGSEELVEDIDGIRAYFSFLIESPPGQLEARALSLSSLELSSNNALVSGIWELVPKRPYLDPTPAGGGGGHLQIKVSYFSGKYYSRLKGAGREKL